VLLTQYWYNRYPTAHITGPINNPIRPCKGKPASVPINIIIIGVLRPFPRNTGVKILSAGVNKKHI
jgi:hypothetical protein